MCCLAGALGSSCSVSSWAMPKVDHFDFALACDQNVFRLQIAVDDAVGVQVAEGVRDLNHNFEGSSKRDVGF